MFIIYTCEELITGLYDNITNFVSSCFSQLLLQWSH